MVNLRDDENIPVNYNSATVAVITKSYTKGEVFINMLPTFELSSSDIPDLFDVLISAVNKAEMEMNV